jgi:hypothetical protein
MGIHDPIAGVEFNGHTAGQWDGRVFGQLVILLVGVGPAMTAGDDPKHTIVVEGDVPLEVAGTVVLHIGNHTAQRGRLARANITVPLRWTGLTGGCAAEAGKIVWHDIFCIHQLLGNPQGILVKQKLNGVGRFVVAIYREF